MITKFKILGLENVFISFYVGYQYHTKSKSKISMIKMWYNKQ